MSFIEQLNDSIDDYCNQKNHKYRKIKKIAPYLIVYLIVFFILGICLAGGVDSIAHLITIMGDASVNAMLIVACCSICFLFYLQNMLYSLPRFYEFDVKDDDARISSKNRDAILEIIADSQKIEERYKIAVANIVINGSNITTMDIISINNAAVMQEQQEAECKKPGFQKILQYHKEK